jgi:hypothetical protein
MQEQENFDRTQLFNSPCQACPLFSCCDRDRNVATTDCRILQAMSVTAIQDALYVQSIVPKDISEKIRDSYPQHQGPKWGRQISALN